MRSWRFPAEGGSARDAGTFDDTFTLWEGVPVWANALNEDMREHLTLNSSESKTITIFRGYIFLTTNEERRSLQALIDTLESKIQKGLAFIPRNNLRVTLS